MNTTAEDRGKAMAESDRKRKALQVDRVLLGRHDESIAKQINDLHVCENVNTQFVDTTPLPGRQAIIREFAAKHFITLERAEAHLVSLFGGKQ